MQNWLTRTIRLGRELYACRVGIASVELSLSAGFMVLVAFGAYDYGSAYVEGIRLTSAARAGAQQALYYPTPRDDISVAPQAALEEYVGHAVTEGEVQALSVSATADTFCGCSDGATLSCSGTCPGGDSPGQFMRVTLSTAVPLTLPYPWSADGKLDLAREAVVRAR
jgi:hypothetical protein